MSRLKECFGALKTKGRKGLIAYVVAGDPSPSDSRRSVMAIAEAGADIIELGIPWSDPIADGPENQAAMMRALDAGATLLSVVELAADIRRQCEIPIVLMTYANPLFRVGWGRACDMCREAGVDGLLVTDLPLEESEPLLESVHHAGLDTIFLHAPTTPEPRAKALLAATSGFLYVVSRLGVTGHGLATERELEDRIERLRGPDLNPAGVPLAVGFGIDTADRLKRIQAMADAAVVGSAYSQAIARAVREGADPAACVGRLTRQLLGGEGPA